MSHTNASNVQAATAALRKDARALSRRTTREARHAALMACHDAHRRLRAVANDVRALGLTVLDDEDVYIPTEDDREVARAASALGIDLDELYAA